MNLYNIYLKLKDRGCINRNTAITINALTDNKLEEELYIGSFTRADTGVNYNETVAFLEEVLEVNKSTEVDIDFLRGRLKLLTNAISTLPESVNIKTAVCNKEDVCIDISLNDSPFIQLIDSLLPVLPIAKAIKRGIEEYGMPEFSLLDGGTDKLNSLIKTINTINYTDEFLDLVNRINEEGNPIILDRGNYHLVNVLNNPVSLQIIQLLTTLEDDLNRVRKDHINTDDRNIDTENEIDYDGEGR